MGSPFNLVLVCDNPEKAASIADKAYALVDSFNHIFSDYESDSELSLLNISAGSGKSVTVSPALWDIILLSGDAFKKSGGAFDITIGPLSRLWRKARKANSFAAADSVSHYKKFVGFDKLVLDTIQRGVKLPIAGMCLDLGGIAKGYIAQKTVDRLRELGIGEALVDAGGDISVSDIPLNTKGWVIGVNVPETTDALLPDKLVLHDLSVATSGDVYQYAEHNGRKYSHIIDPRTGYGVLSQRNVTIIAKTGASADWLATACSILPVEAAKKLAAAYHADVLIGTIENNKTVYHTSSGFTRFQQR